MRINTVLQSERKVKQDMAASQEADRLYRVRHSLAHVLAQAVQRIRPGTLLGFGPPIDDGFYYDFILPAPLSESDFPEIERIMREIIASGQAFTREDLSPADAMSRLAGMGEPHKTEYAKELVDAKGVSKLSFYTNGPFLDMCEGPHVENTSEIPPDGFRLASVAGAYWRGSEKNPMMTRIYAWAFGSKEALEAHAEAKRLAAERDHRKLGQQLDIYVIDDIVGKGLPLWLQNGTAIRHELEQLVHEMEFRAGYQRVATPHLTREELYQISGHLELYKEAMYPPLKLDEGDGTITTYYLKPMNCPHHHRIYASRKRSYRDLPLRLAEYGSVYRYEKSGALLGLARVRGMTMNDAHIYCAEDQVQSEFEAVMRMHLEYYELFDLSNFYMRLSLPNASQDKSKYVDNPEAWARTEKIVRESMSNLGLDFVEALGEAAFYGPKIDFQFSDAGGREFTVSTNQLDFAIPPRFNLTYTGSDGAEHTPLVIHRAPLGTHERFISFLIEHYGGALPTWLAPIQVRLLPVSDRFHDYSTKLLKELRNQLVRAELDTTSEKLGKKVRNAAMLKIPILLVIGEREAADGTVTVRRHGFKSQQTMPFTTFLGELADEVRSRRHVRED